MAVKGVRVKTPRRKVKTPKPAPKPVRVNKTGPPKAKRPFQRRTTSRARLPTVRSKSASEAYLRQKAVRLARQQEIELVRKTGKGTRPWTPRQLKQLTKGKWIRGYEGHHIRDVSSHSKRWIGDPRNIKFVTRREHLREHKGNFRNPTTGKLIDRPKLIRQAVKSRATKNKIKKG